MFFLTIDENKLDKDLRLSTSHETDGKAISRKASGIALVLVYSSHCHFEVIDLNKNNLSKVIFAQIFISTHQSPNLLIFSIVSDYHCLIFKHSYLMLSAMTYFII